MDGHDDGPHAREPQLEGLARIGAALNAAGARYVLIGGFAVIAQGASRTTYRPSDHADRRYLDALIAERTRQG